MYRIMIVKTKKENYQSFYQYLTSTTEGRVSPVEFETREALDSYVENMLNSNYAKSDFIIVKQVDYTIDAKEYTDNTDENTPAGNGNE